LVGACIHLANSMSPGLLADCLLRRWSVPSSRSSTALLIWALCLAGFFVTPTASLTARELLKPYFTSPLRVVEATGDPAEGDKPFTVIFLADSEPRMRGNTDAEVKAYVSSLIEYKTSRMEYFDYAGGSTHRIDPSLVILGGDISKDRTTSTSADMPIWQQLADHGVAFLAGFGNHDWEDNSWYDFDGDVANKHTTDFCRQSYWNASVVAAPHFGYREIGPSDSRGPVTFLATYKGVQIVNFNTFLYHQSYHYDFESPSGQECALQKADAGFSGCQVFTSAEKQIAELEAALSKDESTTTLFVQHYPMTGSSRWWDDANASNTTFDQKKKRLTDLMDRYSSRAFFGGHQHRFAVHEHVSENKTAFFEYVAPYYGGNGEVDPNQGGSFLAILVSRSSGILEVKHVVTPLAGTVLDAEATSTSTAAPTVSAPICTDVSILPSGFSNTQLQGCVVGNCLVQGFACSSDEVCKAIWQPVIENSDSLTPEDAAVAAWTAQAVSGQNAAVQQVNQCLDDFCGSSIGTSVCGGAADKTTAVATSTMTEATTTEATTTEATTTKVAGGRDAEVNFASTQANSFAMFFPLVSLAAVAAQAFAMLRV